MQCFANKNGSLVPTDLYYYYEKTATYVIEILLNENFNVPDFQLYAGSVGFCCVLLNRINEASMTKCLPSSS